jgi:hypothetical protein
VSGVMVGFLLDALVTAFKVLAAVPAIYPVPS